MNPLHTSYLAGMSSADLAERNGVIYWSVLAGATYKDVAATVGISGGRVAQVFWRERNRRRDERLAREIGTLQALGLSPSDARVVVHQDERENARACAENNNAWYFNPEVRGKYGASSRDPRMRRAHSEPKPDRWRLYDDLFRQLTTAEPKGSQ